MNIVETACYALAFIGLCSLALACAMLALASRAANNERRAMVRKLIRFD